MRPPRVLLRAVRGRPESRPLTKVRALSDEELVELGAIEANLPAGDRRAGEIVPVRLGARVTEVGTLVLEARPREGDQRWNVELSLRED